MYISAETPDQTETRLLRVIASSRLHWHEGAFQFIEFPVCGFPESEIDTALAFVRDDEVWSVLTQSGNNSAEQFSLFSFHFPAAIDNSGFVGWLASTLKRELGTGVFVVCGQNTKKGGIFDYWGIPFELKGRAEQTLDRLRERRPF